MHVFFQIIMHFPQPTTLFNVGMTCEGCANACKRILGKIDGVTEVTADVEAKIVEVTHNGVDNNLMLEKLKKWGTAAGKTVALRNADGSSKE